MTRDEDGKQPIDARLFNAPRTTDATLEAIATAMRELADAEGMRCLSFSLQRNPGSGDCYFCVYVHKDEECTGGTADTLREALTKAVEEMDGRLINAAIREQASIDNAVAAIAKEQRS